MSEAPKFEDGLAALEKLVAEMETGELGLDEALKRFEKGVKLAAQMQKSLEDTNRKIEQLSAAKDAPDEGEDPAPKAPRSPKPPKPGSSPTLF